MASSKKRRILITGFGAFLFLILAFAVFFALSFRTVEVRGESMTPTFNSGDRLLVSDAYWLVGSIKKNDIVVLLEKESGEIVIKRVYALSGETVDFANMPQSWNILKGEYVVPQGHFYVLGDNRMVSEDSREFGPVPREDIIGKVVIAKVGFGSQPVEADSK